MKLKLILAIKSICFVNFFLISKPLPFETFDSVLKEIEQAENT